MTHSVVMGDVCIIYTEGSETVIIVKPDYLNTYGPGYTAYKIPILNLSMFINSTLPTKIS